MRPLWAICMALVSWLHGSGAHAASAQIFFNQDKAAITFAVGDLDAALRAHGYAVQRHALPRAFQPAAAGDEQSLRITVLPREDALRRGLPGAGTGRELSELRA